MKHPGLQRALAAFDDARTELHNILENPATEAGADHTFLVLAYDSTNRAIELVKAIKS